jgi:hypothetical protein
LSLLTNERFLVLKINIVQNLLKKLNLVVKYLFSSRMQRMSAILKTLSLPKHQPFATQSPFLFAVYHLDNYPSGIVACLIHPGHSISHIKQAKELPIKYYVYILYYNIYIHIYAHTCIYTYMRTYIRRYIRTYMHAHIHTYIQSYIHTYIYIYTLGKSDLSVDAPLYSHNLGSDFHHSDGWSMYHGRSVPGFPEHPHKGFETITLVRQGTVDHADSLGCAGRFSNGDTQWMTAGGGVSHCEMFPMVNQKEGNPLDLFQIWLNLPRKSKGVDAYFSMHWSENAVRLKGDGYLVQTVAGT